MSLQRIYKEALRFNTNEKKAKNGAKKEMKFFLKKV